MNKQVIFHVQLPFKVTKRRKWYVASCPVLDVHSQGDTSEKARENLSEALTAFFLSCFERGTLETVLKESGFAPAQPTGRVKSLSMRNVLDVPIPFQIPFTGAARCRA